MNPHPSSAGLPPDTAKQLLRRAREARRQAYAPYSNFPVGAAVLTSEGEVFTGCNVENASYGLSMCAERVAIGKAISEGARDFRAIAVVGPQDDLPCPPCGSCRQVLHEFGPEFLIVTSGNGGEPVVTSIGELLPAAFQSSQLREAQR